MREPSPYFIRPSFPDQPDAVEVVSSIPFDDDESQIDPWKYWATIRKHEVLIISCVAVAVIFTALYVFLATPLYTATSTILIKPSAPQILDSSKELRPQEEMPGEPDYYKTQYEILKSRSLAQNVIDAEGLSINPVFTGAQKKPGVLGTLFAKLSTAIGVRPRTSLDHDRTSKSALKSSLDGEDHLQDGQQRLSERDSDPHPPAAPGSTRNWLVDSYLGGLKITPVPETDLVQVNFTSSDPILAAKLANAHSLAYIRLGMSLHSQANAEAEKFLKQRLVELKDALEKSEIAINDYRRSKGIVPGLMSLDGKETVVLERLASLSKDLTEAQVARMALESQVSLIKKGHNESLPAVLDSKTIQERQAELAKLNADYASLSNQFTPDYPPLAKLEAQREEVSEELDKDTQTAVQGIESAYEAALGKETRLQTEMENEKKFALTINDSAVRYAILQREVDTNRELYNSVLQRMKDVGLAAEMPTTSVSIVDRAEVPSITSEPKKALNLMTSLIVGLMAGIGIAFLLEYLDNTLKNPEEVEKYLRFPNLAIIPNFSLLNEKRNELTKLPPPNGATQLSPQKYSQDVLLSWGVYSPVGEAFRVLRTALLLSRAGAPPKMTLFTSALESEGKTVVSCNTALMFARTGARVLLIDTDLRRPRCHKVFKMDNHFGLTNILTGNNGQHEVIRETGVEGLHILSSGATPPNPAELIGSTRMRDLLIELGAQYDFLIIDSPPVMALTDSVILSTMVDGVVVVADGSRTPKQIVRTAIARLNYARVKIFGVVLNKVDARKSQYGYYYQPYSHYTNGSMAEAAEEETSFPASNSNG